MIGLEAMLITPVLKLRNDLLQAGKAVQQDQEPPEFASLQFCRNDELGEVIAAFAQMYQQVSDSIAERKEAQRASARLAEIGELTAMIVHEVRNPLTTVLMGLNSFQKLELPAKAQLQLGLALEEADRLQRLLNEILLYTKCQILQLTDIELNAFITELLIPIQQMPSVQGRSVTFQPCSTDAWIKGDRDKLKQVFINLVDNACEAIDAGEVVVWAVQGKPSQQIVQIEFHNGGHPIPQDVIPHITKPFYTTKPAGNGLGLAVVKRIVEAHQGKLQVESAAVIGTTIRILLPLVPVG
jgi:signal transduction histidine kinase